VKGLLERGEVVAPWWEPYAAAGMTEGIARHSVAPDSQ